MPWTDGHMDTQLSILATAPSMNPKFQNRKSSTNRTPTHGVSPHRNKSPFGLHETKNTVNVQYIPKKMKMDEMISESEHLSLACAFRA